MPDFLADENVCGQSLLRLVAAGNAIIAEIMRLKDYIPDIFKMEDKATQTKYAEVILDFSYFKIIEAQDKKIEDSQELSLLDEEIRENHMEILRRAYLIFEAVYQYVVDLQFYLRELNEGFYIQQNLETIFNDAEGKQLLAESLYLYGVMLLVLDLHIPGPIRERMLVAYYRHNADKTDNETRIDDICMLLRSTGFKNSIDSKRPSNYPEEYFKRIELDRNFIEMTISRLRSDDLYNQLSVYPLPDHRTTALATQAGMLYVCLYFAPKVLHQQHTTMREIVDKFFSDNWIVSIYMGITIDLNDTWESYKAAKNALLNTSNLENISEIAKRHADQMTRLVPSVKSLLVDGKLSRKSLIKNMTPITNLLRECNVTLRWLMLQTSTPIYFHANKKCKAIEAHVINETAVKTIELFELLLIVSELETKVKELLKEVLVEKENHWNEFKRKACGHIGELSDGLRGQYPLMEVQSNQDLERWFTSTKDKIDSLNYDEPNASGRIIIKLIEALEHVQVFHNLNANLQIKQRLNETVQLLYQMIQTLNVKQDDLIKLQIVGDLSYAWISIETYTQIMQESITKQPKVVSKLRTAFLKLASALEIPLLRINQAQSEDLLSVSQYYSSQLENFVRKVIQVIPKTIFDIVAKIIEHMTTSIKELPTRLDKSKLRDYAQLNERYTVAKHTYSISVLTEGVLMMRTTWVGVIELDPKRLLEDGIRNELVRHLSKALHSSLIFDVKAKQASDLYDKLVKLAVVIDGYKRSFEYVQDYLNIDGSKIWDEEMNRIINYNVEKECNRFLVKKIQDWQSDYQTTTIPIPLYAAVDSNSANFIGRLARELLRLTNFKTNVYVDMESSWFESKSRRKQLDMNVLMKIFASIGPSGLIGIDKLYSHMIKSELKTFSTAFIDIMKDKNLMEMFNTIFQNGTHDDYVKLLPKINSKITKNWTSFIDIILSIGQKQLLRKHIAFEVKKVCDFDAKDLNLALEVLNNALKRNLILAESNDETNQPSGKLLSDVNKYMSFVGKFCPIEKVYVRATYSVHTTIFLALLVYVHALRLNYVHHAAGLPERRPNDQIDGIVFMTGLVTILRQFQVNAVESFIEHIVEIALVLSDLAISTKKDVTEEVRVFFSAFHEFIDINGLHSGTREKLTKVPTPK